MDLLSSTVPPSDELPGRTEANPIEECSPEIGPASSDMTFDSVDPSVNNGILGSKTQTLERVDSPNADSFCYSAEFVATSCEDDTSTKEGKVHEESEDNAATPSIDTNDDSNVQSSIETVAESIEISDIARSSSDFHGQAKSTESSGIINSDTESEAFEEANIGTAPSATASEVETLTSHSVKSLEIIVPTQTLPMKENVGENTKTAMNGESSATDDERSSEPTQSDTKINRSVPPHLRPEFHTPTIHRTSFQDDRVSSTFIDYTRG